MAAISRRPADSLIDALYAAPWRFEFAQALALLEQIHPERTPVGTGPDPRQETVRLSGPLYPLFYPSALGPLTTHAASGQPQLATYLFGLGGPDGPLPYAYQDWLQSRRQQKDLAPAAFLDLFHQRILGQLYRVQGKHRVAAPFAPPEQSKVQPILRALTGLLPEALHHRQKISDSVLLARTTLLANRRRPADGFKALLESYGAENVHIAQFTGAWSELPASHRSHLGSKNQRLGQNMVAGSKIWDEHAGITLTLGPLSMERYLAYLPQGALYQQLMALTAFYFGPEMRCTVVLKLADSARTANDHSGQEPAKPFAGGQPFLLGLTSWLGSKQAPSARHCQIAPRRQPAADPAGAAI